MFRVSAVEDENLLEMHAGDDFTTCTYLMPQKMYLEMVKMK